MMNKSMASLLGFFCIFLITTAAAVTANKVSGVTARGVSHEFKVGDNEGWREPDANSTEMYIQWATKNRFRIGDSLYFEYRNDSVLEVEKQGYYHCNMTKPMASYNEGKTIIKLDKPGPFYFISGAPDHCKNGQRLLINVINPHPSPPSSSTPQPSPPSHPSIAVPPTTDSPAPSPDASSSSGLTIIATSVPILAALVTSIVSVLV